LSSIAITSRQDTVPKPTSAHTAAKENKPKLLKVIIESDASACHRRDENGWTPIHEAVRTGNSRLVKLLIDAGANVNAKTNKDLTPLFFAVSTSNTMHHAVPKLLVSSGAVLGDEAVSQP
jgi:ankyrin repeat protein